MYNAIPYLRAMLHHTTYQLEPHKPWVTFVHGAGGSSAIWFKQIRHFSKHFNVLLLDLRGHGRSKELSLHNLKEYSFERVGNDIIEVLDYLKVKKTHFVGISLGTIIVREITERFPTRTASMIMGGAIMQLNLRGQILMRMGNSLKSFIPYLLLYRLLAHVVMPSEKNKESRILFINEAKKLYQKEFKRWFGLAAQVNPLLRYFRINDSGIPTLYVMGSEDYMFLPSITKLVKNHKSSQLHVIDDCGHVVNVEHPEEFNKTVVDFLNTL